MTRRVKNERGDSFTFFFTVVSPFSNFHPCTFHEEDLCGDKKRFCCVEQYYMYMKAALFDDFDTADNVMNERNPKRMKSLGKHVKGFSQQKWDKLSPQVMEKALTAKFSQNKDLRWYLFLSQGSQMVEASPMDNVWGIGLSMDSPDAMNPQRWRGTNRLGNIMTSVREKLMNNNDFRMESEEALREIALKGSNVFMDLQSDPQQSGGSGFNTPQQSFKRKLADSDPRDAKRQRRMDDFVSTPNSSSYGGNSRFEDREIRTEPWKRNNRMQDDNVDGKERQYGGNNRGGARIIYEREDTRRNNEEEDRLRERIANRMDQHPNQPRFGQPPRSLMDHPPQMGHPMGMMNAPSPGYPQHPMRGGGNGIYPGPLPPTGLAPPLMGLPMPPMSGPPPLMAVPPHHMGAHLPPMDLPSLPMGVPPPPTGVPPPPPSMMEDERKPPPPPVSAPLVIEVQAGVVHSGMKKAEEKEDGKDTKEEVISPSAPLKKSKIKMNLQKERVIYTPVELNSSILSLRKKIQEDEEMMKEEVKEAKEEIKEEESKSDNKDDAEEGEIPKAYAIKSTVQSEKRRQSTRMRKESSNEDDKEKDEEKKIKDEEKKRKDEESMKDRRDEKRDGRSDERRNDTRSSVRDRRSNSRDRIRRRRSKSRDDRIGRRDDRGDRRRDSIDNRSRERRGNENRRDSRNDYRSRDQRPDERRRDSREENRSRDRRDDERRRDNSPRRRDDSPRRRDDRREERKSEEKKNERRTDDKEKESRRDTVEKKEEEKLPDDEKKKDDEKTLKKAKKAEKKAAKAEKKAEKEARKKKKKEDEEGMKNGLIEEVKDKDPAELREECTNDKEIEKKKEEDTVDKKEKDSKKEYKEESKEVEKATKEMDKKKEDAEKSIISERIPVKGPLSSSFGDKKHPRIEAPPPPVATPVTRGSREQNLFQKLFSNKRRT